MEDITYSTRHPNASSNSLASLDSSFGTSSSRPSSINGAIPPAFSRPSKQSFYLAGSSHSAPSSIAKGDALGPSSSSTNAFASTSSYSANILDGPSASPRKRAEKIYGDRFIPSREGLDLTTTFQMMGETAAQKIKAAALKGKKKADKNDLDLNKDEANRTYNHLLKSELFRNSGDLSHSASLPTLASARNDGMAISGSPRYSFSTSGHPITNPRHSGTASHSSKNLFSFSSPNKRRLSASSGVQGSDSPTSERYSVSPISFDSQRLLLSPRKMIRGISKVPYKVLDAPDLADDFYLNLVDWSSNNLLGVGLGNCVYLWSAATAKVTKLCDFSKKGESITSVAWIDRGSTIAIGTSSGGVQLWDAEKQAEVRTIRAHQARVGALAWNDWLLSSGSRDRNIYHRDVRCKEPYFKRLAGHKQEVCGLKWSPDGTQLASGGNDNKLLVWDDAQRDQPLFRFSQHTAAVKAIAWNPHQPSILASGGGTADKKIRFWNSLTGNMLSEVDTGSQICNLLFSPSSAELVSTHGYSGGPVSNHVSIWKYPSMQPIATLTGHSFRVLYLAASPDGRTIVTGAGDETLRFWDVFKPAPKLATNNRNHLDPAASIR